MLMVKEGNGSGCDVIKRDRGVNVGNKFGGVGIDSSNEAGYILLVGLQCVKSWGGMCTGWLISWSKRGGMG